VLKKRGNWPVCLFPFVASDILLLQLSCGRECGRGSVGGADHAQAYSEAGRGTF
jgi:hypothetical protein